MDPIMRQPDGDRDEILDDTGSVLSEASRRLVQDASPHVGDDASRGRAELCSRSGTMPQKGQGAEDRVRAVSAASPSLPTTAGAGSPAAEDGHFGKPECSPDILTESVLVACVEGAADRGIDAASPVPGEAIKSVGTSPATPHAAGGSSTGIYPDGARSHDRAILIHGIGADDNRGLLHEPLSNEASDESPDESTRRLRAPWVAELSGAVGDMGTFLPLAIGLSLKCPGMDFSHILISTGIFNLLTGAMFSVPMPVQPMKTIVAAGIAQGLDSYAMASAGFVVGIIVLLIGGFRVTEWLEKWFPVSLVVGIQLGLGLQLAMKGVADIGAWKNGEETWLGLGVAGAMLFFTHAGSLAESLERSSTKTASSGRSAGAQVVTGGQTSVGMRFIKSSRCVPVALLAFVFGLVLAGFRWETTGPFSFGPTPVEIVDPVRFYHAFLDHGFLLGLAQLPVTLLNSVLSVSQLSETLYGEKRKAGTSRVASSVGMMNVAAAVFATMPCCHGAGGLAAQHKFGARSHVAVVFLGGLKLVVGLVFGSAILELVQVFPTAILGAMLVFVGIELASSGLKALGKEAKRKTDAGVHGSGDGDYWLALLVCAVQLHSNTGIGFVCGFLCWLLIAGLDRYVKLSTADDKTVEAPIERRNAETSTGVSPRGEGRTAV